MEKIILIVHILAAAAVIGLVLLQHGKGADMGAAFGSGASGSLFGVSGSSNLLSKLTALFVAIFFVTSLTLAYLSSHQASNGSVIKANAQQDMPKKVEINSDKTVPLASDVPKELVTTDTENKTEKAKDVPN